MTDQELLEIEEREQRTPEGPWTVEPGTFKAFLGEQFFDVLGTIPDEDGDFELILKDQRLTVAEFVAHAREDIPKLLNEIKRLKEELERAKPKLTPIGTDYGV